LRIPRLRSYRALVAATAVGAASLIVVLGAVAALRSHRASASVATTAASVSSTSAAGPSPAAASSVSLSETPLAASQHAAHDSTPAANAGAGFAPAAARRALDATKRDVGKCRRGRVWGYASATVTFANDGSVDKVTIAPPFGGTPAGACAAEALGAVRVPPFAGAPGSVTYRFYVPPK
jgi:hypothetical protein